MDAGWLAIWTPAEWRRRWPGLISLAVLVAVAGGVTTALVAGARRADSSFERLLDATGAPNLMAPIDFGADAQDADADLVGPSGARAALGEFAAIPGVESVSVESWWAIALYPDFDPPGVVTAFATGTFATAGEPRVPLVLDGELPALDDPRGVIVNDEAVSQLGLSVGETLTLRTASPARLPEWMANDGTFSSVDSLDGPEVTVEVAAVARAPDELGQERFPAILFTEGFARAHDETIAHVEPVVLLRADPSRLDDVLVAAEAVAEAYGLSVEPAPDFQGNVEPSIGVEVTTLRIAAVVAAAAGALVVATAFGRQSSSVALDRTTGAALGLTRSQRAAGAWLVIAPAAVLGALGASFAAWGLSGVFPRGLARLAEPDPGRRFDTPTLLAGSVVTLAIALALLAVVALASTQRARRDPPERVTIGGRLLGSPARQLGASFATDPAGTRRSRLSVVGTVAAIAVGVAGVATVATMEASRSHLHAAPRLFGAPADLLYRSNGTFGIDGVVAAALATDGVDALTRMMSIDEDSLEAGGPGGVVEVEPAAYATLRGGALPPVVAGAYPQSADEVALGPTTAAELGAEIGDTVTITPLGATEPELLRVSGLVLAWDTEDPRRAFLVTVETVVRLVCEETPADECGTVDVFATAATEDARATLLAGGFADVPAPATVDRLDQVGAVPWYLAGFLCVLAAAGLLHAGLTAVRRRRHDLAVVRALGLTGRRAAAALTWQAALTAILGAVFGAVLGAIVGPFVWRHMATDLGVIAQPVVPMIGVAAAVVGGVAVAVVLSLGPRWKAARLPVAAALRSE